MDTSSNQVEFGKRYAVKITKDDITSLQFIFKPIEVDHSKIGLLELNSMNQSVSLTLKKADDSDAKFQGTVQSNNDASKEALLYFDSTSDCFQLTKISRVIQNVNFIRDEQVFSSKIAGQTASQLAKVTTIDSFRKRKQKEQSNSNNASKVKDSKKAKSDKVTTIADDSVIVSIENPTAN